MPDENENKTYLGDGVYAEFNGYNSIELRIGDHRNPVAVVLEPASLEALNRFYKVQLEIAKEKRENNQKPE